MKKLTSHEQQIAFEKISKAVDDYKIASNTPKYHLMRRLWKVLTKYILLLAYSIALYLLIIMTAQTSPDIMLDFVFTLIIVIGIIELLFVLVKELSTKMAERLSRTTEETKEQDEK